VILPDANVLLLDLLYLRDVNHTLNRQALAILAASGLECGISLQALLEVVGKYGFNLPQRLISFQFQLLPKTCKLEVIPDPVIHTDYAGLANAEVLTENARKMALGDAVQAAQIRKFAPHAAAPLTWNAKHFVGKTMIPVVTPTEWLQQQQGNTP